MDSFNLLEQPWIPVLYRNGVWKQIGILKAFQSDDKIRQIAASNPMDRVAVLRFLLAVLYWCLGNPKEEQDGFDADAVCRKLKDNWGCFNLTGHGKRFYQIKANRRTRPTTDMFHEIPTDSNLWHFRHTTDFHEGLCRACCALGLLRLPIFTQIAGNGGNVTNYFFGGIHKSPPIFILPQDDDSLLRTLIMNWQCTNLPIGSPNWDDSHTGLSEDAPPLLFGLTHLPRMVWLGDVEKGVCCICGNADIILRCNIESPGKNENGNWSDPHALKGERGGWIKAPNPLKLKPFAMDRPWIPLTQNLADKGYHNVLVVAFAADKAKKVDVWERRIIFSSRDSDDSSIKMLSQRDEESGSGLSYRMRSQKRTRDVGSDLEVTVASLRPHIEHVVSQRIGELLTSGEEAWQKAAAEWTPFMEGAARSLAPGVTTAAVERREQIAGVKPDMRPREEKPSKHRKAKSDE